MSDTQGNGTNKSSAEAKAPTIRFDASHVKNAYANVCNVSSTKEEIVLNFGLNQAWERQATEMQVELTNRIILSPFAAKRLAMLLMGVMQQYEARFGILDLNERPAPTGDRVTQSGEVKPHAVK